MHVSYDAAGPSLKKYGHLRVHSLLARERFPPHFQGSPLIAQFSSLGSLDERWLTNEFRGSLSAGLTTTGGQTLLCFALRCLPPQYDTHALLLPPSCIYPFAPWSPWSSALLILLDVPLITIFAGAG